MSVGKPILRSPIGSNGSVPRSTHHAQAAVKAGLGGPDGDVDAIAAIRGVFEGRLRIDANEGWSVDEAIERLNELHRFHFEQR